MVRLTDDHRLDPTAKKLLDAAGNVDKFKKRTATATQIKAVVKPKKERKTRTKK